jgi:hypothetical protein
VRSLEVVRGREIHTVTRAPEDSMPNYSFIPSDLEPILRVVRSSPSNLFDGSNCVK